MRTTRLQLLRTRWRDVRLLKVGEVGGPGGWDADEMHMHKIVGGCWCSSGTWPGLTWRSTR